MISRRSLLGLLGLSPVAAPMVAQAAMAPTLHAGGRFVGAPPYFVGELGCESALWSRSALDGRLTRHIEAVAAVPPGSFDGVQPSQADEILRLLEQCAARTLSFDKAIRPHNAAMSCARTAREVKP